MSDAFRDSVVRTLREWELTIERQRHVRPDHDRHGREIIAELTEAEHRLGKDLASNKRALGDR